jgi:predicted nucleotidyltransferase
MDAKQLLSKIDIKEFCDRHGVRSFSIFGSYARGEATSQSDLDVLVEFNHPVSLLKHVEIQQELELELGVRVDVLTPAGLNHLLKERILNSRKLIYEKAG